MKESFELMGLVVFIVGGVGFMALITGFILNFAWHRLIDVRAFIAVLMEAKRQGKSLWKEAE